MDYGGIGRFNVLLFLFVFIICSSITVEVFNPSGDGYQSSMLETSWSEDKGGLYKPTQSGLTDAIWNGIDTLIGFGTFLFRGMALDIPYIPLFVQGAVFFPVFGLLLIVIVDYTIEFGQLFARWVDAIIPL